MGPRYRDPDRRHRRGGLHLRRLRATADAPGDHGGTLHALLSVALLTTLNVCGTRESKRVQIALSSLTLVAVIGVMLAGLLSSGPSSPAAIEPRDGGLGMLGMGMVFVLLTYGGWNETAYLSGELRNPARNMGRVLLLGTLLVTTLYLLTNPHCCRYSVCRRSASRTRSVPI